MHNFAANKWKLSVPRCPRINSSTAAALGLKPDLEPGILAPFERLPHLRAADRRRPLSKQHVPGARCASVSEPRAERRDVAPFVSAVDEQMGGCAALSNKPSDWPHLTHSPRRLRNEAPEERRDGPQLCLSAPCCGSPSAPLMSAPEMSTTASHLPPCSSERCA